jgi:hypothetical protein
MGYNETQTLKGTTMKNTKKRGVKNNILDIASLVHFLVVPNKYFKS